MANFAKTGLKGFVSFLTLAARWIRRISRLEEMIEVGSWTSNRVRRDKRDQTGACPDYEEKQIERSIINDGQYLLFN